MKYKMGDSAKVLLHSVLAGLCAAGGAGSGKLTAKFEDVVVTGSLFIRCSLIAVMVILNVNGYRCYVKALDSSSNSLIPTIISAVTNYIASSFIGMMFFYETTSILWWTGTSCVVAGVTLLAMQNDETQPTVDHTNMFCDSKNE